ncbi:MAG: EamA/RhaT family transporter [Clostridia bacterium]|nr:DMT family transporter [Lachnospiraceae bacterium]NCB99114.1 EamA/RhaT family transporter [Clostridia bacterium]NCD02170.1 EamA/RhaT family transporter [Clostridia bacterium]
MTGEEKKSKFTLILSMVIFGTIGIFRRYIPLPSSMLAMTRGLTGVLFLIALMVVKRNKFSWKAIQNNWILLLVSGALLGFNWILLFEAYQYTSIATATLCYYMAPIIVILVSPIALKEKVTGKKLICVGIALVGMIFISGVLKTGFTGLDELKGVFLGLGAAALYAGIIILNKKMKDIPGNDKTVVQLGTSAVVLMPYVLLTENVSDIIFTPLILCMILVVGILHTGIAYALYFGSMKALKAQTIALFSYIDPIVAIILSALLLHEAMGVMEITGAVLVLGATMEGEI